MALPSRPPESIHGHIMREAYPDRYPWVNPRIAHPYPGIPLRAQQGHAITRTSQIRKPCRCRSARSTGASDDRFQIHEVRPCQAAIAFGVARQDEHLESLRGLFQAPHHPGQATRVGCGQHVVQNNQLSLAPCPDLRQPSPCGEMNLLALAAGDLLDRHRPLGQLWQNMARLEGVSKLDPTQTAPRNPLKNPSGDRLHWRRDRRQRHSLWPSTGASRPSGDSPEVALPFRVCQLPSCPHRSPLETTESSEQRQSYSANAFSCSSSAYAASESPEVGT